MKWKAREREIRRLRRKHKVLCVNSLPDLTVDRSSAIYPSKNSSGGFSQLTAKRSTVSQAVVLKNIIVGTPHKQGPMVMFHDELPWAGGKKS
jgi:hypothetical protein